MIWQVLVVAGKEAAARAVAGNAPALAVVRWPEAPATGLRAIDALLDRRPEVERFLQQHGPTGG